MRFNPRTLRYPIRIRKYILNSFRKGTSKESFSFDEVDFSSSKLVRIRFVRGSNSWYSDVMRVVREGELSNCMGLEYMYA